MKLLIYIASLFLALPPVYGEIYKWTDANGKVHYSDKAPEHVNVKVVDEILLNQRVSSYQNVAVAQSKNARFGNNRKDTVVMYTTSRCGYCAKARGYFAKNNIAFIEKNIETSKQYRFEFNTLQGKGVPLMFLGKYKMSGFSVAKFEAMRKKYQSAKS